MWVRLLLSAVLGYLLGSVNTSILVGRFYGIDVRKHGSGNAGMTNTLRTLGKKAAILVTLGDVLKAVVACLVGAYIIGDFELGAMFGGLPAVLGHNWPLYFGFKGGKGILTTFAVIMMMDWKIGLILFAVFVVLVAITRYISLGSVIGAALFPLVGLWLGKGYVFFGFALVLALLAIAKHSGNIKRLLNGTESKLGQKASSRP